MKRLPLQEEPPSPLPPARRSWGWWRCGAAGSGEGQSGHRRRRRGPAPARRAGGRPGGRASALPGRPGPRPRSSAVSGSGRAAPSTPSVGLRRAPQGLFTSVRTLGGHPQTRSFVCLHEWRGPAPPRPGTRVGSLRGNLRGAARAPCAWSPGVRAPWSVRQTPVRVQAGVCNFLGAQARRCVPARCRTRSGAPPPCRLSRRPSPCAQGLPRPPVSPCRTLRGFRGPQRPVSSPRALSTEAVPSYQGPRGQWSALRVRSEMPSRVRFSKAKPRGPRRTVACGAVVCPPSPGRRGGIVPGLPIRRPGGHRAQEARSCLSPPTQRSGAPSG